MENNSRIELIRSIAKDALELELSDFQKDRTAYLQYHGADVDEDTLSDEIMVRDIVVTDRAINLLAKKLYNMSLDLTDDQMVEFISDSVRSKKVIVDAFTELL